MAHIHVDNGQSASRIGASMQPCMNSSTGHKPRLPDINIGSVVTTQVTDLSGEAAVKMQPLISPSSSPALSCACAAWWPLDHETSDVIARDWDQNSKIRRHCPMRLDETYTAHAVPMASRESAASARGGPNCGSHVPDPPRPVATAMGHASLRCGFFIYSRRYSHSPFRSKDETKRRRCTSTCTGGS